MLGPIHLTAQMRHGGEDVEGITARRGERRIRRTWTMQIKAEIFCQVLPRENIMQQFLVARPEHHGVVIDIIIPALGAEIPNEKAHGIARAGDLAICPAPARKILQKLAVGPGNISVGDNNISIKPFAIRQFNTRCTAAFGGDALHFSIVANGTTKPCREVKYALHQRAHAAHSVMHAVQPFQMRNQAVIGGGRHGIPTDQQRVEAEGNAQLVAGEVIADAAIDGAIPLQPNQIRRGTDQTCKTMKGLIGQLCKGHAKDALTFQNEPFKACTVLRRNPSDFGPRDIKVCGTAHHFAIIEADQVKGVHGAQVNILRKLTASKRPELFKQIRRCNDGGAGIKGEAILTEDISTPARRIEFFKDGHPPAARTQPHRCRQATKAGANHNRMRALILRLHLICHETPMLMARKGKPPRKTRRPQSLVTQGWAGSIIPPQPVIAAWHRLNAAGLD